MIIKNKRGTDKILSVYWFAILFIVAAAVVYMVFVFYGKPFDVRDVEVNFLINKVADCFVVDNYLRDDFRENDLENCGLNFNVEDVYDWKEQEQYYVEVKIKDFNNQVNVIKSYVKGNLNVKENCETKSGGNFPVCLERSFYSITKDNKQYVVEIFVGVRKTEKNVN